MPRLWQSCKFSADFVYVCLMKHKKQSFEFANSVKLPFLFCFSHLLIYQLPDQQL